MKTKLKIIIPSIVFSIIACNNTEFIRSLDSEDKVIKEPFEPSPYHKCPLHKCSNLVRYVRVQNYQNGGLIEERNRSKDLLARCDFGPEGTMNPWLSDLCKKSTETKNIKSTNSIKQPLIEETFVLSFEPDLDTLEIEIIPRIPYLRYRVSGNILEFNQLLPLSTEVVMSYKISSEELEE